MKRLSPFLLGSLIVLPAVSLITGCDIDHLTDHHDWCHDCGQEVTRTFDLSDFDEIECHSALHLTVRQSSAFRVVVTISEYDEDNLEVRRDKNRLRLSLKHGSSGGEVRAVVELPLLRRLEAEDASHVRLEGVSSPGTVELAMASASELDGDLSAELTVLGLDAASRAELSGTTDRLQLNASGVSQAHLRSLPCRRADVELNSVSSATIRVSDWLDVKASELSILRYLGDPQLGHVDLSSGAQLEHEH